MTSNIGAAAGILALALHASAADWSMLEKYQRTISRERFDRLVSEIYAPQGGLAEHLGFETNTVAVFSDASKTGAPLYRLEFAASKSPLSPNRPPPLSSLRLCLDPGHIGGAWARMEERFFFADREDWYVQEAALNLLVAQMLKARLERAGARVFLTKDGFDPVTDKRPADFEGEVTAQIGAYEHFLGMPDVFREASRQDSIRKRSEKAFFRAAEIEARARIVNEVIKPDATICIHFNAKDTDHPRELIEENGLAVFIHGNYLPGELLDEQQKFFLFRKLLEGVHAAERDLAECVTDSLVAGTGLPPAYEVDGGAMFPVGTNNYLYARNLAASRQYDGPVIFLEPYYVNNRSVYQRIQMGDYEGEREVDGVSYRSIFREYADSVFAGVTNYFR